MENIFKTITDEEENILIKGFHDYVIPVAPDEELMYERIQDFDPEDIRYNYFKDFVSLPFFFFLSFPENLCHHTNEPGTKSSS